MHILGVNISLNYPFITLGRNRIDSGNNVRVRRKYGNRGNMFYVRGKNNVINSQGKLQKSTIRVVGNGNTILIESCCKIIQASFVIIGDGCNIIVHENATCGNGCCFVVMGKGKNIIIGRDAMIADSVDFWASDSHAILDVTHGDNILNPSGNIEIGSHVWIGKKAVVLKNVKIGENAVVGMSSVVTKDVPTACIVVGNPAHVVKKGVSWSRCHIKI